MYLFFFLSFALVLSFFFWKKIVYFQRVLQKSKMTEDPFMLAVSQTIDALTFSQTHEVDLDFRAHSRQTIESVRSLQREQKNRIEQTYGPRPASPDFLGTQLLAEYRGEATSVQLAKEAGDPDGATVINAMTDNQCKVFKKEMKQRIHEWEGSVRDATGQSDVTAEKKAPLRSIYELYKASKNRVVTETTRGASTRSNTVEKSAVQPTRGSEPAAPVPAARLSSSTQEETPAPSAVSNRTSVNVSQSTNATSTEIGANIPRVAIGSTPAEQMSDADLQAEKRKLKQVLFGLKTSLRGFVESDPTAETGATSPWSITVTES
ncbi:hypothetical protein AGDE_10927 [Angomonas deanei]|nr:hypothetical protein AGDE_10927 [Angomonas deanei]|eukprot:EPY27115.1 hypothetical protein AGDE_10927 [Angomonas deanei]